MNGQVITFYSYKGGTGRTMALANVATLLSEKNKVLMIDWDLEAPGLHYFFRKDGVENALDKPGLIDLFKEFQKILEQHPDWNSDNNEQDLFSLINLDEYLYTINNNNLFLLAAGRINEDYPRQVATFQWESLFYRAPWLFRSFAKYLTNQYDYVLIDSRTGLNDISGICTALMPDKLVAIFTPSVQSIRGIINAVKSALHFRKESDDLRPLNIFPLPSRLELQEKELFDDWRFGSIINDEIEGYQPLFEELLKNSYGLEQCNLKQYFDIVQIQQFTYYAYGEKIAVSETQGTGRLSLSTSYSLFSEIVTSSVAPWTVQDTTPTLSRELGQQTSDQVSTSDRRRLDSVRIQLRSQRPSDIFRGMQQVGLWLQEDPEDKEVYGLLLDAVGENRDLREQIRNLLIEMAKKGSETAEKSILLLPSSVQDLLADADDAYYAAEYEMATSLYRQVLKLDPENERAKNQLSKAETGKTVEDDNTSLPRTAVQYYRRAHSYIAAKDFVTAAKMLDTAIEIANTKGISYPEAETLLNSVHDYSIADEFKQKIYNLALENNQWKDAVDLCKNTLLGITDETIKNEFTYIQDLLLEELTLHNKGIFKSLSPNKQLSKKYKSAKEILAPKDDLLNYISRQLSLFKIIRAGFVITLILTVLTFWTTTSTPFFASQTNTPTETTPPTNTVVVTKTEISTSTSSPTETATPFYTPVSSLAPIAYGKVIIFYFPVDTPNGKRINNSIKPNQSVTILEQTQDSFGVFWYRCSWEENGDVYEGWIIADYINLEPGPTPTPLPIGYGKTTAYIFPVETPNGKRINHSLKPGMIVQLLEKSDAPGGPWYRCTWDESGVTYEGWILAQYIQIVPPSLPTNTSLPPLNTLSPQALSFNWDVQATCNNVIEIRVHNQNAVTVQVEGSIWAQPDGGQKQTIAEVPGSDQDCGSGYWCGPIEKLSNHFSNFHGTVGGVVRVYYQGKLVDSQTLGQITLACN